MEEKRKKRQGYRYPCPLCGDDVISRNGSYKKWCDECAPVVRNIQMEVCGRKRRESWVGRNVYQGFSPKVIRLIYGEDAV